MIFVNWANFFFIFQIGKVLLLGTFLLSFGLLKKKKKKEGQAFGGRGQVNFGTFNINETD